MNGDEHSGYESTSRRVTRHEVGIKDLGTYLCVRLNAKLVSVMCLVVLPPAGSLGDSK